MKSVALFREWPYVAVAIFAGALLLRIVFAPRAATAKQIERAAGGKTLLGTGKALPAVWLLLLVGHLVALAAPQAVLGWTSDSTRMYLLEGVGLILGLVALVATATAVWRHFAPVDESATGSASTGLAFIESIFLALLGVAAASGVLMAATIRWGSSWGAATLSPYVQSLVKGEPVTALVSGLPFLARLHVISGFALIAVTPFTRIGTLVVLTGQQATNIFTGPTSTRGRALEDWMKRHNPASWIWPEEEDDLPPDAAVETAGGELPGRGTGSPEGRHGSSATLTAVGRPATPAESRERSAEGRT